MLPEGAQRAPNEGLEASGAPLGTMMAQSGRQELVQSRFKAEIEAMLGGPKLVKATKSRKQKFGTRFSIAKRRNMINWDPFQEGAVEKSPKRRHF